jgi:hypothetical protein
MHACVSQFAYVIALWGGVNMDFYSSVICQYRFVCTKKWDDLELIEAEQDRRHCTLCDESVFLARSYEEFVSHASAKRCVAVVAENSNGQLLGAPWEDSPQVDFVEEAAAYARYGRIEQAIEILQDGLEKKISNFEALFKLLEIYREARDPISFEIYAQKAQELTGGKGEWWGRVQSMGVTLEPKNPMYASLEAT